MVITSPNDDKDSIVVGRRWDRKVKRGVGWGVEVTSEQSDEPSSSNGVPFLPRTRLVFDSVEASTLETSTVLQTSSFYNLPNCKPPLKEIPVSLPSFPYPPFFGTRNEGSSLGPSVFRDLSNHFKSPTPVTTGRRGPRGVSVPLGCLLCLDTT